MNYTRSFYFYYLPFYHTGLRTAYHVNDKLTLNYWVVNGANQSEPTNSYKDELFGYRASAEENSYLDDQLLSRPREPGFHSSYELSSSRSAWALCLAYYSLPRMGSCISLIRTLPGRQLQS
jgi:hypothetical protein